MLVFAASMSQLSFGQLMHVYQQSNRENGADFAPMESPERQLQAVEEGVYDYLSSDFFAVPGAKYAIWTENGVYVSAARLEPYLDGLLLEALETAPEARGHGYASSLIQAIQASLAAQGGGKLYSHVGKHNLPSLKVHQKCGFHIEKDCAVYIDGSVSSNSYTLVYQQTDRETAMITFQEFSVERIEEIKEIYAEEGWTAYLTDDEKLSRAIKNSPYLLGAFDEGKLVGFVRALGDGEHFVIVQDLIIRRAYRRRGLGSQLFRLAEKRYADVRMFQVNTDLTDERDNAFYRKMGMKPLEEGNIISYFR